MAKPKIKKYPEGDIVKKPKYSVRSNFQRLASDNTSSYTPPYKTIEPEDRAKEPFGDIVTQTFLDQLIVGKGYNGLQEIPKKYNTGTAKTINLGLEYMKTETPFVGDLIANTLQTGVEMVDSKYAKGGETPRKPIVVNNPNDPRLRAYNDSNYLYNRTNNYRNLLIERSVSPVKNEIILNSTKDLEDVRSKTPDDWEKYEKAIHKNKPIAYYNIGIGKDKEYNEGAMYKKPVQPVVYKKPVSKPKLTNFEKRIQNPTTSIKNPDGTTSTHSMMSFESDGKYYAAPTVVEINGKLQRLSEDDAYNYAMKNKEYKEFKTDAEAKAFATNGYKKGTPLEHIPTKPTYTSQKQMYEGRQFMDSTKLRPGLYHPEEITERMKDPNRKFKKGGQVPQYGNGSTIGSLLGAGVGALGFIGGPQLGMAGMSLGSSLGAKVGSSFDEVESPVNPPAPYTVPSITMKGMGVNQNIYANGGMMGNPNAEIELGEVARMPNGQTLIADAPSHENGGLQLNLPAGTQISSDRLKSPLTGNTFAKDQAQLERAKAKINNTLKYRTNDKYAKKAIDILDKESNKMFEIQERSKLLEGIKMHYKNGGTVPQYPEGAVVGFEEVQDDPRWRMDAPKDYMSTQTANGIQISFGPNGKQYLVDPVSAGNPGGVPFENQEKVANYSYQEPVEQEPVEGDGFNLDTDMLGLGIGALNTGMQFANSFMPEKIDRIRNNEYNNAINNYSNAVDRQRGLTYNVNDMLTEARSSEAATNTFINRNLSSGSVRTGARLGNRAISLNNTNRIMGDANRANLGIQQTANQMQTGLSELRGNLGAQDAAYATDYRNMNLQQKANMRKIRSSALSDLSKNFQLYGRDEELMKLLPLMYPNSLPFK